MQLHADLYSEYMQLHTDLYSVSNEARPGAGRLAARCDGEWGEEGRGGGGGAGTLIAAARGPREPRGEKRTQEPGSYGLYTYSVSRVSFPLRVSIIYK